METPVLPAAPNAPKNNVEEPHPYVGARFGAALAIAVGIGGLGVGLMLAKILLGFGLVLGLVPIPMVIAIYFNHLQRVVSLVADGKEDRPASVELGTIIGILYILPILAVAVFFKVSAPPPAPSVQPSVQVVSPAEAKSLEQLSNEDFEGLVSKLTGQMRQMDAMYSNEQEQIMLQPRETSNNATDNQKNWENMISRANEVDSRRNYDWQVNYRERAEAAYQELCRRLGIDPNQGSGDVPGGSMDLEEGMSLLQTGMLAGANPISSLADYLDSLNQQLQNMSN